MNILRV